MKALISIKNVLASLLIASMLFAPFGVSLKMHYAEAIPVTVTGGIGTIQETISAGADVISAAKETSLWMKEFVLDNVAWMLINSVIHEMSKSIITWINSGFQGSPAFISDLGRFLTGVADKVAGEYIWGSDLNFLCSPFKLDIRIALDIQYRKSRDYKVQCTLTDVINNVEGFANSANPVTNWDSWFQVALRPENNVYGSYLLAEETLSMKITNAKGQEVKLLDFGKGFLSKRKCEKVEGIEKCSIETPGSTIEHQLNTALDLPAGRLQIADEINEILAALFAQLARQAIGGVGGLLGLTSDSGGGGSYFDRVDNSTTTEGFRNSANPIEDSIEIENDWKAIQEERLELIRDAKDFVDGSCMAGTPLPENLQSEMSELITDIVATEDTLDVLGEMALEFRESAATPAQSETNSEIMDEYLQMQSDGSLHHEADLYSLRMIDLADTRNAASSFTSQITSMCAAQHAGA